MRFWRRAGCIGAFVTLVAVLLAGCAALPRPAPPVETLTGRLSLQVRPVDAAPRALTAQFELRGNARAGSLDLSTPLGTMLAKAHWSPQAVVLETPHNEKTYPDLDALTRDVLGESLPVAALFDWLQGRPWPGAPSEPAPPADEPGFVQLGWIVGLARFGDDFVTARREKAPPTTVRVKLERP